MLRLRDVSLAFGGIRAIRELDLDLGGGVIGAVIGANGAGKTSILNVISRFYQPQAGSVEFNGVNLLALRPHQVIGSAIARSFQNVALFEDLTVFENLLIGADHLASPSILTNMLRLPKARRHEREARTRAERVIEFFDIGRLSHRRASELGFADRKLVDLGRALVGEPRLLMLDEPAAGMTEQARGALAIKIKQIRDEWGTGILLIDHDMELVLGVAEHVVAIDFGAKIAEGDPASIRTNPAVVEAYLGQPTDTTGRHEAPSRVGS